MHKFFPFVDEDPAFPCPTFFLNSDDSRLKTRSESFPFCLLVEKVDGCTGAGLTFIGQPRPTDTVDIRCNFQRRLRNVLGMISQSFETAPYSEHMVEAEKEDTVVKIPLDIV